MQKRSPISLAILILILSMLFSGCGSIPGAPTSASTGLVSTLSPASTHLIPTPIPLAATYSPIHTALPILPLPTNPYSLPIDTPTAAPVSAPTQTAPAQPLPSPEELKARFNSEINPLVKQLLAAGENPAISLPPEVEIIYIPQTEQLHYDQSIVQFARPSSTGAGEKAYLLYNYSRGATLGYRYPLTTLVSTETQQIIVTLRLIVEENGKYYLVEKEEATGGAGSLTFGDLVKNAIPALNKLPAAEPAMQAGLEEIVGYACGIDMDPALNYTAKVALLTSAMGHADWADRRQAAEFVGELKPPALNAAPALITLLADANSSVAIVAENTLVVLGKSPQALDLLIKAASSPVAQVRQRVARILGFIDTKPEAALPPLLTLFHDREAEVREAAVVGLGAFGNPGAIPPMNTALTDKDADIRKAAARVLQVFGPQAVLSIPNLTALLDDRDAGVRGVAADALGAIDTAAKTSLPVLIKAAQAETDGDAFRLEIGGVAGLSSKEDTLALLKEALNRKQANIRTAVFDILQSYLGVAGAVELLIPALRDNDALVRKEAAWALFALGSEDKSALPELIQAAQKETDLDAFYAEMNSITPLSSQADTLPLLKETLNNSQAKLRIAACRILESYAGVDGAVELLISALNDPEPNVRQEAAMALSGIGAQASQAAPALIEMVASEKDNSTKVSVVVALGKIGPAAKAAVPVLIPLLKSSDYYLKTASETALKAISGQDYGEDIQKWTAWWKENS